jgi:hypothetical protein
VTLVQVRWVPVLALELVLQQQTLASQQVPVQAQMPQQNQQL